MPMKKGREHVAENIREFHQGETYASTMAKHGKAVADRQAIAAAMAAAGVARKKKRKTLAGR